MIAAYDPLRAPDAPRWLALSETDRRELVERAHEQGGLPVGENARMHAMMHIVIENQAAMGDPPAIAATLHRLQEEGLDRHEAVHAAASVLASEMSEVLRSDGEKMDLPRYAAALSSLTAEQWRSKGRPHPAPSGPERNRRKAQRRAQRRAPKKKS
jgi:hypothetical protein